MLNPYVAQFNIVISVLVYRAKQFEIKQTETVRLLLRRENKRKCSGVHCQKTARFIPTVEKPRRPGGVLLRK